MSYIIEFDNVYKKFRENSVLNGLNFHVNEGEIMALLGHNGAGKTTTLRVILGLLNIDKGLVKVFGDNPICKNEKNRKQIGVLSEDTGLYESLTVSDNLTFFAEIYGCNSEGYIDRMNELLYSFNMYEYKDSIIKDFSLGMKKKVALIRTLFHNPRLVLMDEPINALDPISIQTLHREMNSMKNKYGTTFIISTHNLDEVVKVCNSIVIIKDGRSVKEKAIRLDNSSNILEIQFTLLDSKERDYQKIKTILDSDFHLPWKINHNKLVIKNADDYITSEIIFKLSQSAIRICEVAKDQFDLEELYIQVEEENNEYDINDQ